MALNDVRIVDDAGVVYEIWQVQDRTSSSAPTTLKPGEPVKQAADGSPYVIAVGDGDPEIGTDLFVGICTSVSTETTTADGVVTVAVPTPGVTEFEVKATTSTNVDTQAEIDALVGDCVTFDRTGSTSYTFTLDEDEGNDNNVHGCLITGGDPVRQTLTFKIKTQASQGGAAI